MNCSTLVLLKINALLIIERGSNNVVAICRQSVGDYQFSTFRFIGDVYLNDTRRVKRGGPERA